MSDNIDSPLPRPRRVVRKAVQMLFENSLFLIAGALAALIWANVDHGSYESFINTHLEWGNGEVDVVTPGEPADQTAEPQQDAESEPDDHGHGLTLHFLVNDVLMALFFAIAAKEVWESLLPGGSLSNVRKAAMPLIATVGGVVGPVVVYLVWMTLADGWNSELKRGWAVPCATDIAFCYLVARIIFGAGHPAIAFLLLLAIADDAIGLVIIAVAYPKGPVQPLWLLLSAGGVAFGYLLHRVFRVTHWRWYLLGPGVISWLGFYFANLHPALGLVPIIPTLPHAHTDLGIFVVDELKRRDTLNAFEHALKNFVEVVLGLFGLVNAGVVLGSVDLGTWLVLGGLLIGKPVGICLFSWASSKTLGLRLPDEMNFRELVVVGFVAAIGFTVALFVAEAAFHGSGETAHRDAVKMGALLSFGAAGVSIALAKVLGIKKATG